MGHIYEEVRRHELAIQSAVMPMRNESAYQAAVHDALVFIDSHREARMSSSQRDAINSLTRMILAS